MYLHRVLSTITLRKSDGNNVTDVVTGHTSVSVQT